MSTNKKLLLIEKKPVDRKISFTVCLSRQNRFYEIISTSSLAEAEKSLLSESFDLVVLDHLCCTDYNLNCVNFFKSIPVILITDKGNEHHGLRMMEQGVDDVLIRDKNGKFCTLLPVTIDKTLARRKAINNHYVESQIYLSSKNDPFQRLTAGLAHDLSNMLSPILGFSKMLLDETEQNDRHFELLEEIQRSAIRAKNMVRQLAIFREKEAREFIHLDMGEVVENLKKALQNTLSDRVTLNIKISPALPLILGDIALLEQALMTLSLHLQDVIHHQGEVNLSISEALIDEMNTTFKEGSGGTYLLLRAEGAFPAGEGEQFKNTIFQQQKPGVKQNEIHAGTSGFALIQAIVKQHGGCICIEENNNRVCLDLYFPVSSKPLLNVAAGTSHTISRECSESILLVEGNSQLKKLITVVLQQKGYTVQTADTEDEAYEHVCRGRKTVDLLLADTTIIEPGNNRICTALAKYHKTAKSFYMTAVSHQNGGKESITGKLEKHINKPFSLSQLTDQVRKVLDGSA